MKIFNKKLLLIILLAIFLLPCLALAKPTASDATSFLKTTAGKAGAEDTNVTTVSSNIIKATLAIVGMIFFILVFYGGFLWMTARENEEQAKKAKSTVIGSIIGVMIIIGSYAGTNLIMKSLVQGETVGGGGPSAAKPGEPTGCCLDEWQTEGGWFGDVGVNLSSGWTGSILTETQCKEVGLKKEHDNDSTKSQWLTGVTDITVCKKMASEK